MGSSEIRVRVTLDASQFNSALSSVQSNINSFSSNASQRFNSVGSTLTTVGKGLQSLGGSMSNAGSSLISTGRNIIAAFAPVTGIMVGAMKAGINFEDAFAGVKKTTDENMLGLTDGYEGLKKTIINMSKVLPQSASSIANVMELSGQLGLVSAKDLEAFTKVAIMMNDTTNLSAEEAITSMTRLFNITGTSKDKVGNLASAIVHLGNNSATTEQEIMSMVLRIASASSSVGIADKEMLAWATTMSSLALPPEMAGSAFSSFVKKVQKACVTGGAKLEGFASVSGMSSGEFVKAFGENPSAVMVKFLQGLVKIEDGGGSVAKVLDDLDIKEIRQQDTLMRLTGAVRENADGHILLEDAMKYANEGWNDGNKLIEEANKKYATTGSQLAMFKNRLVAVGLAIYDSMAEPLSKVLGVVDKFLTKIEALDPKILGNIGVIALLGTAFGAICVVLGSVISGFGAIVSVIGTLVSAFAAIVSVVSAPVVGAIVALGGALVYCWNHVEGFKEGVMNAFNRVKTVVSEVVQAVWSVMQSVWSQIKPFVTTVFVQGAELIGQAFMLILSIVVPIIENVWNTIQTVWGAIAPYVQTVFSGVVTFLTGAWQVIYTVIKTVMDLIKAVIEGDWSSIGSIISNAGQMIWQGLQTCWNGILQMLSGIWNGIVALVSPVWNSIWSIISSIGQSIWSGIQSVWNSIVSFLGGLWSGLSGSASSAWTGIWSAITTIGQAIWDGIVTVWNGIVSFLTGLWNGIVLVVTTVWTTIYTTISTICQTIWAFIQPFWDMIVAIITVACDVIRQVIQIAWSIVQNIIENVCNVVFGVISVIWQNIVSLTTTVWNAISGIISTVWNAIKSAVTTAVNAIKSVVTSVWNGIKSVVSSVMNGIKSVVTSAWNGVKSTVSSVVNGIKSVVSSGFNAVKTTASNIFNGVRNTISTALNGAWTTVTGIVSKITSAFRNMKISIPKPKLPHINVGSKSFLGGKVTIPTFSISWNAKGSFLDSATLIGAGEAGKEAILPLSNKRNMKPFSDAVTAGMLDNLNGGLNNGNVYITNNINATVNNDIDIQQLSEKLNKLQERELRRKGILAGRM